MTDRRLLYVVNDAAFFLSHRLPLALAAKAAGYDVHVATPADAVSPRIARAGFEFHAISMGRRTVGPASEGRAVAALVSLYRRLRPTLVHHVTSKAVIYGGIAARLAHVPAVVAAITGLGHVFVDRGAPAAILRSVVLAAYRVALAHPNTTAIFQNPDDRELFVGRGILPDLRSALIRGSGVDPSQFAQVDEPAGKPTLICSSRMLWRKGVGDFVDAARMLRAQGFDGRFVLVGGVDRGNPSAVPEAQLLAWQREGVVEWWGHRSDMPGVLGASNVVCLPSAYGEGVPKALIEAAACGRAMVATDVPGCREIVRHGETGLLVPVHDPAALANALKALANDADLRRRMGAAGRALVCGEFSLARVIEATLSVYRSLLGAMEGTH